MTWECSICGKMNENDRLNCKDCGSYFVNREVAKKIEESSNPSNFDIALSIINLIILLTRRDIT